MTTKTITIDRVEDLQDGDEAVFKIDDHEYTGPVYGTCNFLYFATRLLRDPNGTSMFARGCFVSATREVPALPTEPLSVITDVLINTGRKFPHAVLVEEGAYDWITVEGIHYRTLTACEIVSFKLAKVVPA